MSEVLEMMAKVFMVLWADDLRFTKLKQPNLSRLSKSVFRSRAAAKIGRSFLARYARFLAFRSILDSVAI